MNSQFTAFSDSHHFCVYSIKFKIGSERCRTIIIHSSYNHYLIPPSLSLFLQTSFVNFDRDRSGTVEPHELQQCLVAFGYNLSPQAMGVLLRRYSNDGRVGFDDFVSLCVRLRALTCEYSTPRISDVCGENDTTAITSCSNSMHINIHILHYNSIIHQIVLREFIYSVSPLFLYGMLLQCG